MAGFFQAIFFFKISYFLYTCCSSLFKVTFFGRVWVPHLWEDYLWKHSWGGLGRWCWVSGLGKDCADRSACLACSDTLKRWIRPPLTWNSTPLTGHPMASSTRQLRSILANLAALSGIPGITRVDPVARDDIPKALDLSEGERWESQPRRSVFVHFPFRLTRVLYVLFMFKIPSKMTWLISRGSSY